MGFMLVITSPSHVLVMRSRITMGKLLNFCVWVSWSCVPLNYFAFSELFEIFALESCRTCLGFFCEASSFHLFKTKRKRWNYALLTGSFTSLDAALKVFSESLKSFASGGSQNTEIFFLWAQSSCWVSHNDNRSALLARFQMSQRQCLMCFILIRLHLVFKRLCPGLLAYPKISKHCKFSDKMLLLLITHTKKNFLLLSSWNRYLVSDFEILIWLRSIGVSKKSFPPLQAYRFSQLPEMVMGSPPPPVPPRTGPVAVASLRRYLSAV